MMLALYVMCITIIICTAIRYVCIWNCQKMEYNLYSKKNQSDSSYEVRHYWYSDASTEYWGYVIYNIKTGLPFTGSGSNRTFTIYRKLDEAESFLAEVNKLHDRHTV